MFHLHVDSRAWLPYASNGEAVLLAGITRGAVELRCCFVMFGGLQCDSVIFSGRIKHSAFRCPQITRYWGSKDSRNPRLSPGSGSEIQRFSSKPARPTVKPNNPAVE